MGWRGVRGVGGEVGDCVVFEGLGGGGAHAPVVALGDARYDLRRFGLIFHNWCERAVEASSWNKINLKGRCGKGLGREEEG